MPMTVTKGLSNQLQSKMVDLSYAAGLVLSTTATLKVTQLGTTHTSISET